MPAIDGCSIRALRPQNVSNMGNVVRAPTIEAAECNACHDGGGPSTRMFGM